MSREEILGQLKEILNIIKPKLDLTQVNENSTLRIDLGIDSLSMLLVSLAVENKFNFQFSPDAKLDTVSDVIDYIEKI